MSIMCNRSYKVTVKRITYLFWLGGDFQLHWFTKNYPKPLNGVNKDRESIHGQEYQLLLLCETVKMLISKPVKLGKYHKKNILRLKNILF